MSDYAGAGVRKKSKKWLNWEDWKNRTESKLKRKTEKNQAKPGKTEPNRFESVFV